MRNGAPFKDWILPTGLERVRRDSWIKAMTLPADKFLRRFLLHVLPDGFHRIRLYGLFASAVCAANIERIRALLVDQQVRASPEGATPAETIRPEATPRCRCCAGIMTIIETFARGSASKNGPAAATMRLDSS